MSKSVPSDILRSRIGFVPYIDSGSESTFDPDFWVTKLKRITFHFMWCQICWRLWMIIFGGVKSNQFILGLFFLWFGFIYRVKRFKDHATLWVFWQLNFVVYKTFGFPKGFTLEIQMNDKVLWVAIVLVVGFSEDVFLSDK